MEAYIGSITLVGYNFAMRSYAFCSGQIMSIADNQALFALLGTTYGGDGRVTYKLPELRGRVAIGAGAGPGLTPIILGRMAGRETMILDNTNLPSHTHIAAFKGTGGSEEVPLAVNVEVNVEVDVAAKVEVSTEDGQTTTASSDCFLATPIPGPAGADQPEKIYRSAADGLGANPGTMHVQTDSTATATATATVTGNTGGITGGSVTNQNTGGNQAFSIYQPFLGINYEICLQGIFPSRN